MVAYVFALGRFGFAARKACGAECDRGRVFDQRSPSAAIHRGDFLHHSVAAQESRGEQGRRRIVVLSIVDQSRGF